MFRLSRNERSHWSGNSVHIEPESVFMIGRNIQRDRIGRLRREMGLSCKQKCKFKATTHSAHSLPVAENLLGQVFTPTKPNEVWTGDITYIATDEGWLYLAGLKDVFTCEIVGYAMGERMTTGLVSQALFRAVQQKRPPVGLIHHTDRGIIRSVLTLLGQFKQCWLESRGNSESHVQNKIQAIV